VFFNNFKTSVQPSGGGGTIDPEILNGKQDKFADIVEKDGLTTLIAGKEIRITGLGSQQGPSAGLDLLEGFAKLTAYGSTFIAGYHGEVSLEGEVIDTDNYNINVNNNRIRNLADPIFDNDAVNKQYLETILEQKFSEFINVAEVGQ
jgi:hypothetical protein